MSKKAAEEGFVTRQIKQRRRNEEWYSFLLEKRNALALRLRSSGNATTATSQKSYGSFGLPDVGGVSGLAGLAGIAGIASPGGVAEELDLPELDIDGGLLEAQAWHGTGARSEPSSPVEALRLYTSSLAMQAPASLNPLTSQNPVGAYDPHDASEGSLSQAESHYANDTADSGSPPKVPGKRGGANTSPAASPRSYEAGGGESSYASDQSPLLGHAEQPIGLLGSQGTEKGSPLRTIKGPGGVTFDVPRLHAPLSPLSPHPSDPASPPQLASTAQKEEVTTSDFAAPGSPPTAAYLFGAEDWTMGFPYSGAAISPEELA